MRRTTLAGDLQLAEDNIAYLRNVLQRVEAGWRPGGSSAVGANDYRCDATSGCSGKLPGITGKCAGGKCQLDPALNKVITFYAGTYGIPYDLLHVTQLVEYFDDRQTLQGPFDTYNLLNALAAAGCPGDQQKAGWAGLGYAEIIEMLLHQENNPGVGYNNIHSKTVWDTQQYFAGNYPGTDMANLTKPNENLPQTIMMLATTDGNMRYAAAHLRQLANERTGNLGPHVTDLTVNDQAIIYGAYRKGVDSYGGPEQFRTWPMPLPDSAGQIFLDYYYRR